ncbi:homeobox domain-containing protein, partial [Blyttiomyces helicus]
RYRRRTTADQLRVLEAAYRSCNRLNRDSRVTISQDSGLTVREVQVWFQNRRAKEKR